MKQAAFNREFRLVENFSVKHIINHSSDIKHLVCSVHAVCESVYWLAAVALEEIPYFRIAKKRSVVGKSADEFPLISCLPTGNLHSDFLGCSMATNATTGLLLHGIPMPLLHQQGKRWQPQPVVRSKQMESHAQEKHSQHWTWWASSPWRVSRDWQSHPTSAETYRITSGRPINTASLSSLSSDTGAAPPVWDLPKFGHVSTDGVYWAGSGCTCSYCNHMFK